MKRLVSFPEVIIECQGGRNLTDRSGLTLRWIEQGNSCLSSMWQEELEENQRVLCPTHGCFSAFLGTGPEKDPSNPRAQEVKGKIQTLWLQTP